METLRLGSTMLSWVTRSGESQPCYEDTQAVPWRASHEKQLRPPTVSQHQPTSHVQKLGDTPSLQRDAATILRQPFERPLATSPSVNHFQILTHKKYEIIHVYCCFKLLSFAVISYTETNNKILNRHLNS